MQTFSKANLLKLLISLLSDECDLVAILNSKTSNIQYSVALTFYFYSIKVDVDHETTLEMFA